MKEEGFKFDVAYTSVLKRAIKTLNNALEAMATYGYLPIKAGVSTKRVTEHYKA